MVVHMLVSLLWQHPWLHPGWKILPTRIHCCSNTNCAHSLRCEDNNSVFSYVQPRYYRMRQVEPFHQLLRSSQALFLNISALGAMPKQQQEHSSFFLIHKRLCCLTRKRFEWQLCGVGYVRYNCMWLLPNNRGWWNNWKVLYMIIPSWHRP